MVVFSMRIRAAVPGFLLLLLLASCGGGGGGTGATPAGGTPTPDPTPTPSSRMVSTIAGGSFFDGSAATAKFYNPSSIVSDGVNIYVADTGNHKIRKIDSATGAVTTLAGGGGNGSAYFPSTDGSGALDGTGGTASFYRPTGITTDGTNLYVSDTWNHVIRKVVISTGVVTTLAGGKNVSGALDGTGTAARFSNPEAITTDGVNLYVADTVNFTIRKIVIATGAVTTLAGGAAGYAVDGTGTAASFGYAAGIATDGTNLYVADAGSHTIRKVVISTAVVTTVAGGAGGGGWGCTTVGATCGTLDGTGAAASFNSPHGIATDGTNLYVADTSNDTIRKVVIATGAVTTLAGNSSSNAGSVDGSGTAAGFFWPSGIIVQGSDLYVSETGSHKIRKIAINTAAVTTFAGSGTIGAIDGVGLAASFSGLNGDMATDGTNLYLADTNSHVIRKLVIATGVVSTIAGGGGGGSGCGVGSGCGALDGVGAAASFYMPMAIATDGTNLYVIDGGNGTIRQIVIATGTVSTIAGNIVAGAVDGTGTAASFNGPRGMTTDGTNLYVADSMNGKIRKVAIASGVVTTLAGSGVFGSLDGTGTGATFGFPRGITTDGTNLYVADSSNNSIRKIVISTGVVTTYMTGIDQPYDIDTFDGKNLYVTEYGKDFVRLISTDTNGQLSMSLFAGSGDHSSLDGTGATASFYYPQGITTDGVNVFVSEFDRIRKIF
ncbi:MAG: hypothetical protein HZB47_10145 [Nitrosomonadales bacterium]|nr:hypothetical protein [Nitrosomonadales bacterium]